MLDWNSPDSMHAWKVGFYVASAIFILLSLILGGVGELVFSRIERRLEKEKRDRLGEEVRASQNSVEDARKEQARLSQELEEERQQRAALEKGQAALREQQEPRMLSAEQRRVLTQYVARLRGWEVRVQHANDPEAQEYARQIREVFQSVGIQAWAAGQRIQVVVGAPQGAELRGVVLRVSDTGQPPAEMRIISEAFAAAGIDHYFEQSRDLEIFIGPKRRLSD